ncbi:MAG: hypothetical protein LBH34_00240 [Prevotellaceae bacterium]|jgi:hypothetical protein|nr:hypothetical protein [Prevotellaceae bacterium]
MCKKVIPLMLALVLCLGMGTDAMAASPGDTARTNISGPAAPVTTMLAGEGEYSPIGDISEAERKAILADTLDGCDECVSKRHFSFTPHVHEITSITSRYVGQRSRGVVTQTVLPVKTTSQLVYENSRSVSNSWNVSIGFEKSAVTGALGYNVDYSTTATASYALDVPVNKMGAISLWDMYNVTTFNAKTTWIYDTVPTTYSYDYGTGWAEQWTRFGFSGKIW